MSITSLGCLPIRIFHKANNINICTGHVRNHSSGGLENFWALSSIVDIELLNTERAHSQPVLCMEICGGKVLTGSQVSLFMVGVV